MYNNIAYLKGKVLRFLYIYFGCHKVSSMISKSRQKLLLEIDRKGSVTEKEQNVYNAESAFFMTVSYLRDNGLIFHKQEHHKDKRYTHSYHLTGKGKVFVTLLKTFNSSNGYHDPALDAFNEIIKILETGGGE